MRAPRRIAGLVASLALTAALALGLLWAAPQQGSDKEGARAAAQPTPAPIAGASPAVSPPPLPPAAPGYTWFVTPEAWAVPVHFAVQVPVNWVRTVDANFVPEGTSSNFPYPQVPQLMVLVSRAEPNPPDSHPAWQHPWVWQVGKQGGGGCSGDVSGPTVPTVSPSSAYTSATYTWDIYRFTCDVVNINYPPGISYDGRAAQARVGDLILSIVAFEPVGSGLTAQIFQHALDSFRYGRHPPISSVPFFHGRGDRRLSN